MGTITKEFLSGSTSGLPIQITVTGVAAGTTTGTTIHTSTATGKDEVYVWASNMSTGELVLSMQLGTLSGPREVKRTITGRSGAALVIPGWPYAGAAVIRGHATSGVSLSINGYVNRIVT